MTESLAGTEVRNPDGFSSFTPESFSYEEVALMASSDENEEISEEEGGDSEGDSSGEDPGDGEGEALLAASP